MGHALQYYRNAIYHSDLVKSIYKSYIKSMSVPTDSPISVLDIGCGSGKVLFEVLIPLLPKNCSELVGVDLDISVIEHCKSLSKSLKLNKEINFQQMDIANESIPEKFKNYFDLIFSSYCFTQVRNLSQGLINSHDMLKPNGELLYILMYKKNYLDTTYREMSKIDIWKPFTEKYADFVPHFSSTEPDSQLMSQFGKANLKILAHEFRDDINLESTGRHFLEVFNSLDTVYRSIPEDKRPRYNEDFLRIFSNETGINFMGSEINDKKLEMNFPTVIVHAKK